jgi:hypothetical protein
MTHPERFTLTTDGPVEVVKIHAGCPRITGTIEGLMDFLSQHSRRNNRFAIEPNRQGGLCLRLWQETTR